MDGSGDRSRENLWAICASTVLVMAGQGVTSPVLPLFARRFGVTASTVGLTITAFGVARLLLNLPLGLVADRWGRRWLLVGGPFVSAIGMFGSATAQNIATLLVWRFIAGAGSAAYMTGAQVYLVDISAPHQRARYLATNQAALLTGVAIGPGVGGLVAEVWGLRAPFTVVGATSLVAAAYSFLRLPETLASRIARRSDGSREVEATAERPTRTDRSAVYAFARSPEFLAVSFVTLSIFATRTGGRGVLVALRGTDDFGMGAGELGAMFTVTAVVGLVLVGPAGWIADRYGRAAAIVPAGLVAAVGTALIGIGPGVAAFVAGNMVQSIGTGISGPAPAAFVADQAPADLRGLAMGLYRTAGDLGFVLGPPLLGAIADGASVEVALVANAALLAASSLVFLAVARRRRASAGGEPAEPPSPGGAPSPAEPGRPTQPPHPVTS